MHKIIYTLAKPAVAGLIFTAGAIADILTTAPQVHAESNPVAAWVFCQVGFWSGAILMKLGAALIIGAICYVREYPAWFEALLWTVAGFSWIAVSVHNISNLI